MATTIATRIRIRTVTRTRTRTRTVTATHTRRTANAAADMDDVQALLQTLANIQTPFRIASSARPARTRTSCCSAMAATRGITPIASSPKWTTYPMAIGEYNKKKEQKMKKSRGKSKRFTSFRFIFIELIFLFIFLSFVASFCVTFCSVFVFVSVSHCAAYCPPVPAVALPLALFGTH